MAAYAMNEEVATEMKAPDDPQEAFARDLRHLETLTYRDADWPEDVELRALREILDKVDRINEELSSRQNRYSDLGQQIRARLGKAAEHGRAVPVPF